MGAVMQILATVKPGSCADEDAAKLRGLAEIGVTAVRVNLGRRDPADNLRVLRLASGMTLFADLPGVKGRIGTVAPSPLPVGPGTVLDFGPDGIDLTMPSGTPAPVVGDELLLDDGRVRLRVDEVHTWGLRCRVVAGTSVPRNTGVVISSADGPRGQLTVHDRELAALVGPEADYLCLSFVDSAEMTATPLPARRGVVAKIETPRGIGALASIVPTCDGVMLARGDLAAFLDADGIRRAATAMIRVARDHGRLVVFATDFFRGLITAPYQLTDQERRTLDWVARLRPDYLMLNETGFSPRWAEVASAAVAYSRG